MTVASSKTTTRLVLLGASGFVGKSLQTRASAEGQSLRPVSSAEIDLVQTGAGQRLAEILESGDTLVFASAITPDKGKDMAAFVKNIAMGHEVAQALRAAPVAKVIYISSDAVFAEDLPPITEETLPCPNGLYGIMHLAREKMLEEVCAAQGIKLLILRPCAIYGPGDTHGSYGPNRFLRMALTDGVIRIFGEGEEVRPHLQIGDFVEILMKLSALDIDGVIHAIPSESLSFLEVAKKVAAAAGRSVRVENLPQSGKPTHKRFKSRRLTETLPSFRFKDLGQALAEQVAVAQS